MSRSYSVVEYQGESRGGKCGYCKLTASSYSHGMWAHLMTVQDYQDLINRGWRRSGQYCYKPNNKKTCCPLYTIKCDVPNFKLNKSHKKILKRMNKFLRDGVKGVEKEVDGGHEGVGECFENAPKKPKNIELNGIVTEKMMPELPKIDQAPELGVPGVPGGSKDPPRKAKQMRLERKIQKLAKKGETLELVKPPQNQEKSLEDFLNEAPKDGAHKLELKIVPSSAGFTANAFAVYRKYQITVHKDPPSKITEPQYSRFLCESPMKLKLIACDAEDFVITLEAEYNLFKNYQTLIHNDPPGGISEFKEFLVDSPLQITYTDGSPPEGYGSFHQQYWLDDKLIAVAVIDILPQCVSSVYFFYDPDYSFLSLGTYSSLREIELTHELSKSSANLNQYYMGFYVHACPKMRYKARLNPSYLLCSETYTWHLINEALLHRLDEAKYQRFNPDPAAKDADKLNDEDLFSVKVLHSRTAQVYGNYLERTSVDDMQEVSEYAALAGKTCAQRMLLYRE